MSVYALVLLYNTSAAVIVAAVWAGSVPGAHGTVITSAAIPHLFTFARCVGLLIVPVVVGSHEGGVWDGPFMVGRCGWKSGERELR